MNSSPWAVVPAPDAAYPIRPLTPAPDRTTEDESWSERIYAALPLFIVGIVCVVVAILLYLEETASAFGASDSVRLHPWILFVALGITGLSSGTVALFAEDVLTEPTRLSPPISAPPTLAAPKPKTRWLFGRSRRSAPRPAAKKPTLPSPVASRPAYDPTGPVTASPRPVPSRPAVTAPSWDESEVGTVGPVPQPKEAWDETPEELEAGASEAAPADFVLRQLDELEASLRKKPLSPRRD